MSSSWNFPWEFVANAGKLIILCRHRFPKFLRIRRRKFDKREKNRADCVSSPISEILENLSEGAKKIKPIVSSPFSKILKQSLSAKIWWSYLLRSIFKHQHQWTFRRPTRYACSKKLWQVRMHEIMSCSPYHQTRRRRRVLTCSLITLRICTRSSLLVMGQ